MQILVARQPIFDRAGALFGYDLLLRRPDGGGGPELPPERLVVDTFLGIGIDQVAAGQRAFVTVDRDMLLSESVRLLPRERVVLQIDGTVLHDGDAFAMCEQLVASGYTFAVDSPAPEGLSDEIIRMIRIVKVDVANTPPELLPDLSAWLRTRRA